MSFSLTLSSPSPQGGAFVQTARPTPEFWAAWRASKDSLKSLGYAVTKEENQWLVRFTCDTVSQPLPSHAGYCLQNKSLLYPYQAENAGVLCAALIKHGAALDASETGTGKTFTAFAIARELGLTPAIVCPKSVVYAWMQIAEKFRIKCLFTWNWEGCKSKNFPFGFFDKYGYRWKIPARCLLIFDEVHKAKGEYTQNAQLLIAAKRQGIRTLCLSATIASSPVEMRALGYTLGLHALTDFTLWKKSYGCYQNTWNGWECANVKMQMQKLSAEIFPARGGRVRIADLGDAFPETQITAEVFEIENVEEQNRKYAELVQEIERLKAEKKENIQASILTLNLRFRQLTEFYKVPLLARLIGDYEENGLSVVVFVNFLETLSMLHEKTKSAVLHGMQSAEERQQNIDAFQADKKTVIVCQVAAGGVGVSLHDIRGERMRVALLCPTYSAIGLKQALGRVHRIGGTKSLQRLIYAKDTIEEEICRKVSLKLEALSALNDGDLMESDMFKILGPLETEVENE